ncbi:MAG: hypothetical protein QXT25_03740 [Candidatus Anstonellaceae archaeon]
MAARKNISSNENAFAQPKFRSELYDQSRLKFLSDNLKKLDELFHTRTPDGRHVHKGLSLNEKTIARKLKD